MILRLASALVLVGCASAQPLTVEIADHNFCWVNHTGVEITVVELPDEREVIGYITSDFVGTPRAYRAYVEEQRRVREAACQKQIQQTGAEQCHFAVVEELGPELVYAAKKTASLEPGEAFCEPVFKLATEPNSYRGATYLFREQSESNQEIDEALGDGWVVFPSDIFGGTIYSSDGLTPIAIGEITTKSSPNQFPSVYEPTQDDRIAVERALSNDA